MKDFIEKWNTDARFKTKIQLGLYTLFVIAVAILAFANKSTIPDNTTVLENKENDNTTNEEETIKIDIPEKYRYSINITINEKKYQYTGTKNIDNEYISKISEEETTKYIYQNEKYYIEQNENYILTTKEEVYNIIEYNYLNLETINKYLSKSTKENNKYIVSLKDIILGNESEEGIIITLDTNRATVDYTKLINLFDSTIEYCMIEFIIEEVE